LYLDNPYNGGGWVATDVDGGVGSFNERWTFLDALPVYDLAFEASFQSVDSSEPTPEPATSLLVLGGIALTLYCRRSIIPRLWG
jgi:hypothetical protein